MKISRKLLILLILLISANLSAAQILNYKPFYGTCIVNTENKTYIAIRKFLKDNEEFLIAVDPERLRTLIIPFSPDYCSESNLAGIRKKFDKSKYMEALTYAERNAKDLQNAGFTHFLPSEKGVNLTADLCPSKRPLDREIFTQIIRNFSKEEKPAPIGLAVTGLWMEKHEEDIKWLVSQEQQGLLTITWINHSYHHSYSRKLPLKNNFLLEPGTDLNTEVLKTEMKMLELGLLPSVFFRFPGLVSDFSVFTRITDYGLIPIGSDAWLGKNQWPKPGSIILIHANGNEPLGVKRFIELLQTERENILHKHWFLYDLRDSVSDAEAGS